MSAKMAVMPYEHYKNACDLVRLHNNTFDPIPSGNFEGQLENAFELEYDKGYDDGYAYCLANGGGSEDLNTVLTEQETLIAELKAVLETKASGGSISLEVAKVTANTYANETTYNNEEFILFGIHPKTYGTVSITYGGVTKTITDTSGLDKPVAQKVFFGTFNGVCDDVETPSSGTLTIKGDYNRFSVGIYNLQKTTTAYCDCITAVNDLGLLEHVYMEMFVNCSSLERITFGENTRIRSIGNRSISGCVNLRSITIPASVKVIAPEAFAGTTALASVVFENTEGWTVITSLEDESGTPVVVTNAPSNALNFVHTYADYYWVRS